MAVTAQWQVETAKAQRIFFHVSNVILTELTATAKRQNGNGMVETRHYSVDVCLMLFYIHLYEPVNSRSDRETIKAPQRHTRCPDFTALITSELAAVTFLPTRLIFG